MTAILRSAYSRPFIDDYLSLTSPPSGGWTWFVEPTAVEYNGKIYFTYVDGSNGNVCIRSINSSTLAVSSETILHSALEADDHDVPSILVRQSDRKILCFYCKHVGANLYQRVSSNAEDISAFATETDLSASITKTTGYTYPSPVQLASETNSPIYLFFRDQTGSPTTNQIRYSKSTDGGSTWSAQTTIYSDTNHSSYWKITSNSADRIDFAVTNGHPFYDGTISIGHFYYTGGSYYKTDGTALGAPPFAFANVSTVYSGTPTSWVWDIAIDSGTGYPRIAYAAWTAGDSNDSTLYWARWTGTAWETHQVCVGGSLDLDPTQGHYYTGGISFDHSDPNTVYCSREIDGQFEMFRYVTSDNGSTWTGNQLTHRSGGINIRPVGIRNHAGTLKALWMYAPTYSGYTNFQAAVRGFSS